MTSISVEEMERAVERVMARVRLEWKHGGLIDAC
jgi:hypothetical protein